LSEDISTVNKMNPHQKNKVDVKSLSPEEQRLFRLYGKLPSRSDHFAKHLKERKYFDSGDYALSKAGKADSVDTGSVGSQHPNPEDIPHLSSPPVGSGANGILGANGAAVQLGTNGRQGSIVGGSGVGSVGGGSQAGSPVKESSFLNRETSADDDEEEDGESAEQAQKTKAIPIRR
jgi:hypothetical protein